MDAASSYINMAAKTIAEEANADLMVPFKISYQFGAGFVIQEDDGTTRQPTKAEDTFMMLWRADKMAEGAPDISKMAIAATKLSLLRMALGEVFPPIEPNPVPEGMMPKD